MNPAAKTALLTILLLAPSVLSGSISESIQLSGYYKSFALVYDPPRELYAEMFGNDALLGSVSNRLRIDSHVRMGESVSFDLSYNLVPRIQDQLLFSNNPFAFGIDPFIYRFEDFDQRLYPESQNDVRSFAMYHNLDRACFLFQMPSADLIVGRQPIAWGSARVINPTDIIAPYAYTELDSEHRIGVDAVRLRYSLGLMSELDLGYVTGRDLETDNSAYFVRAHHYLARTDISALIAGFRGNLMIGLDLTRSVGGAGVWLEAAQVFVGAIENTAAGENYFRLTTGLDYSLTDNTYGFIEYHYNQAGDNKAGDYLSNLATVPYIEGNVYLLGEHYLIPGLTRQLTPLLSGGLQAILNLGDPSASIIPSLEYSVAQNVYMQAGAYLGFGDPPDTYELGFPAFILPRFNSEFGSYPDFYYLCFAYYF